MDQKNEIWGQALLKLLENVNSDDPKSVFLHFLTPFGIFGDQFILLAENPQVESWVKKNYIPEMTDAVRAVSGQNYQIGISSKTTIDQTPPTEPASPVQENASPPAPQKTEEPPAFDMPWSVPPIQREEEPQERQQQPDWIDTYVNPADLQTRKEEGQHTYHNRLEENIEDSELLERCTFDTFVVGHSNEFARGAALAVAEQPGAGRFNPLFIYGKSGLGKTHLLISIVNYINQNLPYLNTLYVPADTFTRDYINSIQDKEVSAFERKYNNIDVLLIDDVQRLENRDETINQLFNIFNKMTSGGKQIVLSADRAPKEINLDERMRSRFSQGLLADIKAPDYETRLAIIKNLIKREQERNPFYAVISEDIQNWLAEVSAPTIRDIQGAITRIVGHMSLGKRSTLTLDEAKEILQDFFPDKASKQISISVIQREVERFFDVSHEDIVSSKRSRSVTYPRHIAIYLSRYLTEESLESIGKKFGNRDHTTVMHSVNKIEDDQKDNRILFDQIEQLTKRIKEQG